MTSKGSCGGGCRCRENAGQLEKNADFEKKFQALKVFIYIINWIIIIYN